MGINEYIQIGNKIKKARLKAGIPQKEMAEKLHISVSTYSNYENEYREPPYETINQICGILKISIDDLLGWNKDIPPIENLENSPIMAKMFMDTIKKGFDGKVFQISFNTKNFTPDELLKIIEYSEFLKTQRGNAPDQPTEDAPI